MTNWIVHLKFRTVRGALKDYRKVVRANGGASAARNAEWHLMRSKPGAVVEHSFVAELKPGAPEIVG